MKRLLARLRARESQCGTTNRGGLCASSGAPLSQFSTGLNRWIAPSFPCSASVPWSKCRFRIAWLVGFVVCVSSLITPRMSQGAGKDVTLRELDLTVTIDTRWAGGAYGGYYPIRVRVINRGPSKVLDFQFSNRESRYRALPNVNRSLKIDQNATVTFTLAVPL